MEATRSDKVMLRPAAMSFSPFQKASSRLTLVLCPAITIERLTTGDFIERPPFRSDALRSVDGPSRRAPTRAPVEPWFVHGPAGSRQRAPHPGAAQCVCGLF